MKTKLVGIVVVILLTLAMSAWADVRQEDVNKLTLSIIKNGTPQPDNLMVYVKIIEPGDKVEKRYYASVWFIVTQDGLVPAKMFFSEEQWVKDGDRYSILQYIIGDIFIDGLPDAGTTATLVEGMDGTVFEYSSKILEGNDLVNKHKELFYKFFAVMTAINL
jgi:hypothetical protein